MKKRLIFGLLAVLALFAASCNSQLELTYASQDESIDKYISKEMEEDSTLTASYNRGSVRLTTVAGEGEELKEGGLVNIRYSAYVFTGSSIESSKAFVSTFPETATSSNTDITTIDLRDNDLISGLKNGLVGVKAGEDCYIIFSAKYGFQDKAIGTIPANSALAFRVKVYAIENN